MSLCRAVESLRLIALRRSTRLATFPDVLVVNASRFKHINWVPQKVEVPIIVPFKSLSLDQFLAVGIQEGEEELPESAEGSFLVAMSWNAI